MPRRRVELPYQENRIAEVRHARGLSMDQLGDLVKPPVTGSQIDKVEKGQTQLSIGWLVRIARALECAPQELLPDVLGSNLSREEELLIDVIRELGEPERQTVYRVADALKPKAPIPPTSPGRVKRMR
jgi:transcriptional regulator with XRE-family HTH domain